MSDPDLESWPQWYCPFCLSRLPRVDAHPPDVAGCTSRVRPQGNHDWRARGPGSKSEPLPPPSPRVICILPDLEISATETKCRVTEREWLDADHEVEHPSYRYAWRDPVSGRSGYGTWCTDPAIVAAAVEQFRRDEPELIIGLETRLLVGFHLLK